MIADVNIPGVGKFDFGNSIDIANVDENYRRVVSQLVRKQTLDTKFSSEEIEKVLAEKAKGLGRFVGVENYEEENAGFTFHKDQYYAYIKIPAMAIKSKDGNYYLYAETKAAIQVYSEDGKLQYNGDRGSNLGIHNNGHPFFHNKGDYTWLCLGDARLPTEGKNNGEVIAKRLLRLKEILMFGVESQYFDPISEPFRYEKNIRQYVRSFEEVQRLGVPIVEAKK
jgi:hypothetical protein